MFVKRQFEKNGANFIRILRTKKTDDPAPEGSSVGARVGEERMHRLAQNRQEGGNGREVIRPNSRHDARSFK